jgi:hypothetical protein
MSQEQYAGDIVKHAIMERSKHIDTPLSVLEKLSIAEGTSLGPKDSTKHRSLVGALQYLTLTWLDISLQ